MVVVMSLAEKARLLAEITSLRSVCAEAYQMAGAMDCSVEAMDNLSAAAGGEPLPHQTFLPHMTVDETIENQQKEIGDLQKVIEGIGEKLTEAEHQINLMTGDARGIVGEPQ